MGVLSDLSGKSHVEPPAVADRAFLEIDVDNFDARMKAMAPRVAFAVPNTPTGEGNLAVDLTFEAMSDFEPGAIAARVEPLRALLEARRQLSDLMAYMDGKAGAEALIETILADPSLLAALGGAAPSGSPEADAALATLRNLAPPPDKGAADTTGEVLSALAATPVPEAEGDDTADVLAGLSAAPVEEAAEDDVGAVLAGLSSAPEEEAKGDTTGNVLAGLSEMSGTI